MRPRRHHSRPESRLTPPTQVKQPEGRHSAQTPGRVLWGHSHARAAFHDTGSSRPLASDPQEEGTARYKGQAGDEDAAGQGSAAPPRTAPRAPVSVEKCVSALLPQLSPDPRAPSAGTHLRVITEHSALGAFPFHPRHSLASARA